MLRRPRLQLIALGTATAIALVRLVDSVVSGLVLTPLTQRAIGPSDFARLAGDAAVGSRLVRWAEPLSAALVFAAVLAIVIRVWSSR